MTVTYSREEVANWWATAVSRMEPGVLELRGQPVQDSDRDDQSGLDDLADAARRVGPGRARRPCSRRPWSASVDHGPQAPSIAAARMAATCGVGLNSAIATGVNMLGDAHGGAGQQCVELLTEICDREDSGTELGTAAG